MLENAYIRQPEKLVVNLVWFAVSILPNQFRGCLQEERASPAKPGLTERDLHGNVQHCPKIRNYAQISLIPHVVFRLSTDLSKS